MATADHLDEYLAPSDVHQHDLAAVGGHRGVHLGIQDIFHLGCQLALGWAGDFGASGRGADLESALIHPLYVVHRGPIQAVRTVPGNQDEEVAHIDLDVVFFPIRVCHQSELEARSTDPAWVGRDAKSPELSLARFHEGPNYFLGPFGDVQLHFPLLNAFIRARSPGFPHPSYPRRQGRFGRMPSVSISNQIEGAQGPGRVLAVGGAWNHAKPSPGC